jgi:hypothetical protein
VTTYRNDSQALTTRLEALEQELAALAESVARRQDEIATQAERAIDLERQLKADTSPAAKRTRLDAVLATIAYVPLASTFGAALAVAAGLVALGLPTMLVTDDPGNWLFYVLGVALLAGAIGGAWHAIREIWSRP